MTLIEMVTTMASSNEYIDIERFLPSPIFSPVMAAVWHLLNKWLIVTMMMTMMMIIMLLLMMMMMPNKWTTVTLKMMLMKIIKMPSS